MALTPATGVDGSVTLTGHAASFNSWTLNISQALVDVTGYGDTFAKNVGGLKFGSWTASGTLEYDAASTAPAADDLEKTAITDIVFQVAAGCTYTFDGIITSASLSSDVGGGARITFAGVTSDAIVEAWDVGA